MANNRDRDYDDEDDRPRRNARNNRDDDDGDPQPRTRRNRDEDDGDERPSKRGGNRYRMNEESDDKPVDKKMSILGLLAVIGGVLSLLVSFIPCVGSIAIGTGVIGLIMGGIALIVAGGSNHGKGLPIAGIIVNLLSIVVAIVWLFVIGAMGKSSSENKAEIENAEAIEVTAAQLAKDYSTNIVKADTTYKGKVVQVTGRVKLVSKERIGRITVELGSGDNTIDCDFGSSADLTGVNVGQTVTIRGRVKGVDRKTDYVVVETCKLMTEAELKAQPTKPMPTAIVTDSAKLVKDYMGNSVKADGLYKGKYLEVNVVVVRVSTETGKYAITASAEGGGEEDGGIIQCEFPASGKDDLAKLEPKDKITIRGTCKTLGGIVYLTGCTVVK